MADSWPRRFARTANGLLRPLGLQLVRRERAFEMEGLLARAARHAPVQTWVDVGASDGSWSLTARRHFPAARFLLFEPLAERQAALAALARRHGFIPVPAAAGAAPGHADFAVAGDLDGSGMAAPGTAGARTVPVATIDRAIAEHQLGGPFGIKLDTHGHELAVLAGATETLAATELLVIEAYNFTLAPGAPRFHELCAWLEARGFRCCDLADPMRRPRDAAFWQVDLAFARATHPMFAANSYE